MAHRSGGATFGEALLRGDGAMLLAFVFVG